MKVFTVIIAIITLLLLSSMLICGLWIGANGADSEGIAFHRMLGAAGVASGILTAITALIAVRRNKTKAA